MSYVGSKPSNNPSNPTSQTFTGNNSLTEFTLNRRVSVPEDLEVFVSNVQQQPTSSYTIEGNGLTLKFSEAPPSGQFYVVYRVDVTPTVLDPNGARTNQVNTFSEAQTFSGAISGTTGTFSGDITANGNIAGDNSTNITGIAGVTATSLTGTLQTASQPNITSTGTLTSLNVSGDVSLDGGDFVFNESSADKNFRIESNGKANMFVVDGGNDNVGIGVSPESAVKLEVDAGSDGAVAISARSDGGNGNNRRFNLIPFASGGTYGGGLRVQSRNSSNVFETALEIDNSKILTHFGQSNWQVAGGSTALYFQDASNSNYGVCGFQPATYNGGINTWYTQNSTHFAIKTGGTIGFYMKQDTRQVVLSRNGSTSPFNTTAQLTVNPDYNNSKGGIAINTYAYYSGIPGIHIYNNDTNNGRNSEDVLFRRNSSTQGYIRITGASGVNYYSASDYRLKEDNKEITDAIGQVKKLKPYNFKWKNSGEREDGFFAHEVDEVFDYAVDGKKDAVETKKNVVVNKEGIAIADNIKKEDWEKRKADSDNEDNSPKGETTYPTDSTWQEEFEDIKPQVLDPAKLVPILTAALQEAMERIETLEAKVKALEEA